MVRLSLRICHALPRLLLIREERHVFVPQFLLCILLYHIQMT